VEARVHEALRQVLHRVQTHLVQELHRRLFDQGVRWRTTRDSLLRLPRKLLRVLLHLRQLGQFLHNV
jgi:hypothetical protein